MAASATPLPSLGPSFIPTSTPSPSPLFVNVIIEGAVPVWLIPAIYAGAVLAAAALARYSLWLGDRRRFRRQDQRQWDRDLDDAYIAIVKGTRKVALALARGRSEPGGTGKLADANIDAI